MSKSIEDYIKNILANHYRFRPDKELTEIKEMIVTGMNEHGSVLQSTRDVKEYLSPGLEFNNMPYARVIVDGVTRLSREQLYEQD